MVVGGVLGLALIAGAYFAPARWAGRVLPGHSVVDEGAVAFLPGTAIAASGRVEADGIDLFDPEGEILFLTVAIDSELTVLDWIRSSLDGAIDLRSRDSVFGNRSDTEQRERNRHLMASSKDVATIVALQRLGVHAADFTGVLFLRTVPGGPADGLLEPWRRDPVDRRRTGHHGGRAPSGVGAAGAGRGGCDHGGGLGDP